MFIDIDVAAAEAAMIVAVMTSRGVRYA